MQRPVMIYDGECTFCRRWIARWQRLTGDRIEYLASQDPSVSARFAFIPRELYAQTVVLAGNGRHYFTGAAAVVRSLADVSGWRCFLWVYQHVPAAASLMETAYRWVARHRPC